MQPNNRSWKALLLLALALGAGAVRWEAELDERSDGARRCVVLIEGGECSVPSSSWLAYR